MFVLILNVIVYLCLETILEFFTSIFFTVCVFEMNLSVRCDNIGQCVTHFTANNRIMVFVPRALLHFLLQKFL